MQSYSLSHLSDGALARDLATFDARHNASLAALLAHLAEFDARRLHRPAAFPSLKAYCVGQLHWCEQAALKRIRAARAARRFPDIRAAVAEGRLHLSAVVMLAPHLTPENAEELLEAATHRSRAKIEELLAQRFPRPDVPARLEPAAGSGAVEVSPGTLAGQLLELSLLTVPTDGGKGTAAPPIPGRVAGRVSPLAPERYLLQVTLDQQARDLLARAQALLGHRARPHDVAGVLKRALGELVERLEKRKCGAVSHAGRARAGTAVRLSRSKRARHIPAPVRRAVWERDGGRCAFVGESGRRCEAREQLEYDHVTPVARGGAATVEGVRLLCRAHNQLAAERAYGAGFMDRKRAEATRATRAAKARREAASRPAPASDAAGRKQAKPQPGRLPRPADEDPDTSVIPWLRSLGLRADQAKRAAEAVAHMADAPLEARLKSALASHASFRFPSIRRSVTGAVAAR